MAGPTYGAKYPFPRLRSLPTRLSPVRNLERISYEGFNKGSRVLVAVFVGLQLSRFLKRAVTRTSVVAATEVLKPGQSVIITALGPARDFGGKRPKR